MKVPFAPPFIDEEIIEEVSSSLRSGWITTGPKVRALEEATAAYCGIEQVLCVNSATSGLMLVLHWLGVGHGDEVIVPAYTYCATALAVMHIGATPVMVDVEDDFNLSLEKTRAAITSNTKAIIPVDFAGWPCDYDAILALTQEEAVRQVFTAKGKVQETMGRIAVISDAAHSFGAIYKNRKAGSLADITVFSFHAVKNLTTAEGGAICITLPQPFNNREVYSTLRLWTLNGQTKDAFSKSQVGGWRYDIVYPGFKMNMPDVCAAIGLAQIRKYDNAMLAERKRVFDYYNNAFANKDWALKPPYHQEGYSSSYHLYPLRILDISEHQRDTIIQNISEKDIAVNVHFIPLPMLTVFKNKGYDISKFPNAYRIYAMEISLPIYPQLNNNVCKYIVNEVSNAVSQVITYGCD